MQSPENLTIVNAWSDWALIVLSQPSDSPWSRHASVQGNLVKCSTHNFQKFKDLFRLSCRAPRGEASFTSEHYSRVLESVGDWFSLVGSRDVCRLCSLCSCLYWQHQQGTEPTTVTIYNIFLASLNPLMLCVSSLLSWVLVDGAMDLGGRIRLLMINVNYLVVSRRNSWGDEK